MSGKKVVIVATGGTIAMKYDEAAGGLVPACSGEDLARAVPNIDQVADLEFLQLTNVASCAMTPSIMWKLFQNIREILSRNDVAGVVVTHGTDTVEETAYFLNMLYEGEKPIICTAAMRGAANTSPDGPMNILCAVRAAADEGIRGMGVLVCLNEMLFSADDVTKTHAANPATFDAPWWGCLGYVDPDRIIIRRKPVKSIKIHPKELSARVDIIKPMTGSGREYVDFAVQQGCQGIVVEGFGRGNVPPGVVPGIEDAVKKGVKVVIVSRTAAGRVLDVYGYPGSVTDSRRAGAVMGGELTAAKARLQLMLILSETPEISTDQLQRLFD